MNIKISTPIAIGIILILAILVGFSTLWQYNQFQKEITQLSETKIQEKKVENLILFEKQESWGPCPPNNICNQTTKLYYSGELILEGEMNIKKELDGEVMEKIKNQIESSGIIDKDCWIKAPVPDYSATYTFYLEGKTKKMRYPNCEEELKEIETLIK